MYGYIYKITNNINGKIYIGKRAKSKFDESYWGSGLKSTNAINKYGREHFSREVLEWCKSKEELNKAEVKWILEFNATNPKIGYNLAPGGEGGNLGTEAIRKISEAHKGKATWNTGRTNVYSNISLAKMSESHKGLSSWNKDKTGIYSEDSINKMIKAKEYKNKPVYCIEKNQEFKSSREACIELKLPVAEKKKINRCCLGHVSTAFGYHWEYRSKEN